MEGRQILENILRIHLYTYEFSIELIFWADAIIQGVPFKTQPNQLHILRPENLFWMEHSVRASGTPYRTYRCHNGSHVFINEKFHNKPAAFTELWTKPIKFAKIPKKKERNIFTCEIWQKVSAQIWMHREQ